MLFTIHHPHFEGAPPTRTQSRNQGPIDRHFTAGVCNSESEVAEHDRRTVTHEVGHHFGIGDARLHNLRMVSQQASPADHMSANT
jgi:hypothetical protein